MFPPINHLAVLVAGLVAFAIGGIWYALFGKLIYKMSKQKSTGKGHPTRAYIFTIVFNVVTAFALAVIMAYVNNYTLLSSLKISFLVWLGFNVPESIGGVLWKDEPFKGYFLGALLDLIVIVVMGIIITLWH